MELQQIRQLYARLNDSAQDFGQEQLLHQWISHQCRCTPDHIAVVWEDQQLTYAQLDAASDRVALRLNAQGITPGSLVGICCSRQLDMPVLLLGILKTGAAYVPLDPEYPIARLGDMVSDSRVSLILAHRAQAKIVETFGVPVLYADATDRPDDRSAPGCDVHPAKAPALDTNQPAYVIYTSGSTGRPKGVVISHRSVVNVLHSLRRQPGFTPSDRILAATTLSFDISVLEIFLPLVTGGSIAVVNRETAKDAQRLSAAIAKNRVNVIQATPAMWRMILESGFVGGPHLTFYTGGEPLPRDLMRKMLPHCREIWNLYGPTEATVYASVMRLTDPDQRILIGWPVANTQFLVVDEHNELCPPETPGELLIGGVQLATEYLNRPELTAEKFVVLQGQRYYRTGDLAQVTDDGLIDHLGRIDAQIKLNGHRIELGEVEALLASQPGVRQAAVTLREDAPGSPRLVGYVLPQPGLQFDWASVRESLKAALPEYMVPAIVVAVDQFYYTPSGKLDRKAFPPPMFDRSSLSTAFVAPRTPQEIAITAIWQTLLQVEPIGIDDNFFELGGNSLRAATFIRELKTRCQLQLGSPLFFDAPTVRAVIQNARPVSEKALAVQDPVADQGSSSAQPVIEAPSTSQPAAAANPRAFAIIGMAARFPGAATVQQFWQNLINGVESIRFFKPEELDPSLDPAITGDPSYVAARGTIDGAEMFDANFFAEPPTSAALIDPQQRVMLEVAYEALEDAAIRFDQLDKRIGVWAGTYNTTYHHKNILSNPTIVAQTGEFQLGVYNEKDYIASRIAYKLNLNGPAINVNTACSTSLVAVIEACNSLAAGQCDAAIAGACSIYFPQFSGHLHQPGSIFSPDGHCRPFDADRAGTLFSDGAGAVVLKRLDDALRDGDRIYATICGLGINNDGTRKASFSAPTISGEAGAVAMAIRDAGFTPRSISYIEAHGTATPVGDPIEIAALQSVFAASSSDRQFCAIGSVKSNIGHTVAAAGMAGLIKTALALHHQVIPKTLHYQRASDDIHFEDSPFRVCDSNRPWPQDPLASHPRRAGVSSFGVGGTNAHVVLEEAPALPQPSADQTSTQGGSQPIQFWPLSAKSEAALAQQLSDLACHCQHTTDSLTDIAYTLQTGRNEMAWRAVSLGSSLKEMHQALTSQGSTNLVRRHSSSPPPVVFMFPGQGAQYLNMGRSLYESSPIFRDCFDRCCELLMPRLGCDLRSILFVDQDDTNSSSEQDHPLRATRLTQPAMFALGYSMGRTFEQWGIRPSAMIGHSIGEFAAACLAGVFSLEDGLELIAQRGVLMQNLPPGSMLSVRLAGAEVEELLKGHDQLGIAAYNGPSLCVVAGPASAVQQLQHTLESRGVTCRPLQTSHAFHSPMMDCVIEPFHELVRTKPLAAPTVPILSSVTGQWLTEQQATDPQYWSNHLRRPVRFADAVANLWSENPDRLLLELGPRRTLTTLAKQQAQQQAQQQASRGKERIALSTLGDGDKVNAELHSVVAAIAQLWCCGVKIDWQKICLLRPSTASRPKKVSLPTYPFQRQRHFIDPPRWSAQSTSQVTSQSQSDSIPQSPNQFTTSTSPLAVKSSTSQSTQSQPESETSFDKSLNFIEPNCLNPEPESNMTRWSQINRAVREVLENTSGFELQQQGDSTSFFEMGFDSLLLTQTAKALSQRFQTSVSLRQLLEQTASLGSLTSWLDERLPATEFAVSTPDVPALQAVGSTPTPTNWNTVNRAGSETAQANNTAACTVDPNSVANRPTPTASATPIPAITGAAPAINPNPADPTYALMISQLQLMQSVMQSQLQVIAGRTSSATPSSLTLVDSAVPTTAAPTAKAESVSVSAVPVPAPAASTSNAPAPKAFGAAARVTLSESELTSQQQAAITSFCQQYSSERPESKRQAQQHRRYLADARTVSGFRPSLKEMTFPLVVNRSKGVYLWDVDGHRYVDLTCGFGSNFLGHGPEFMIEAMTAQLQTDYSIGPQTPLAGEVARLFSEITGCERVAFANSGSEAVLGATRLARTYTGKDKIVMFHGDYHGILDEVIVRGNSKLKSFPAATGIPAQHVSNTLILEYGDPASLEIIQNHLHELAAVVVEPVQSRRPELQPREFLQQLSRITQSADTALIMDEVISGLRIAPGGAQQYFGVTADIATYGKVVGGGMPIGVIAGKAKYMDGFDGGFWQYGDDSRPEAGMTYFAGTFCRHPVTMAAAKRILEFIRAEGQPLYDRLNALADNMAAQLNDLFQSLDAPLYLANFGSLFKVQFKHESPFSELVFAHLRRHGYFIWDHRPCLLTIQHTQEHVDGFVKAFRKTILDLQSQGLLGGEGYKLYSHQVANPIVNPSEVSQATPHPDARPGKDRLGNPGYFIADPLNPGRYLQVGARL